MPKDVATRAMQLSKEFDGNLPPLLLTFNGGHEATDYELRRSVRRVRRKSASFSGRFASCNHLTCSPLAVSDIVVM